MAGFQCSMEKELELVVRDQNGVCIVLGNFCLAAQLFEMVESSRSERALQSHIIPWLLEHSLDLHISVPTHEQ